MVQYNAVRSLWALAWGNADNQKAIAQLPGSIRRLVKLLGSSSKKVQESAAAALEILAVNAANRSAIDTAKVCGRQLMTSDALRRCRTVGTAN
jgi:hypothetical protein